MNRMIVVGGGFGGMAAALRARAKGYEVTLIDRCPRLGGRAQVFEKEGFRHDAGPTVLTAPFLFEELFALFGRRLSDAVTLVPLDPWYRFEFADGSRFDYGGSMAQTLAEIERISPEDVVGYQKLLEDSRRLYEVGFTRLSATPFHSATFMLRQVPQLIKLGAWRTVWQMVRRRLRSENLRQAFTIQPLLVGGNPFDTTSIYGLIHFLESAHGVHFAMGGTGALVDAMETLMTDVGIDIQLGTTVERILVADNRVTGARLSDGTSRPCDAMISDADPAHLYEHMLPTGSSRPSARLKARHAKKSMGLFVLFFGATRQYPDVAHHTIWMGPRYRDLLADIFDRKILAEDFSIYLHRPTATDPNFAPKGCDSFYALVPVPNLEAGIDWSTEGPRLQDRVVKALSRTILPDLEQHIRADFFMTPENFAADYLSPQGAGFSIAPIFRQSAWFRFHNRAEGPSNLYLVGAGTHPGAGLPGVLCSAKVVDQILPAATPGPHPHLQTTSRALQDTGSAGGGGEAEAILRYHGRSFHLASRLLGNPGRANAARLYAFCRFVDDLADTSEDPIQAGRDLRRLREDVVQQTPRSIQSADFLNLSAEVNLPIAAALSLIDTVLRELEGTRLAEQSDLITYAQGVAGTVGLMMCSVLGATDPKAKPFAVDLGIAMQLTNIARDVGEDAEMGRVYLPATWLDGLSPEQILRPDKAQQRILRQATARCLALADQYYARGLAGLKFLPIRSRCAIGVAANVYRAIGNRIAAADYRSWDHRAIVPVRVRLLIAAACLIRQLSSIGRAKATTARTEVPPTRHRVADVASNSEAP